MSIKKIIKKLHLYVALALCLPLIIQGLTGSILIFQSEISHALLKRNHVFSEGEIQSAGSIVKAASAVTEKDFQPNLVKISDVASVRFMKNEGEKKFASEVILDPVSLEVLQVKNPETDFFRFIKKFHATLLIKGELGHQIVSVFGFALLFLAISGLILWFPKFKNLGKEKAFTFTFKFRSVGKKFHRDLHVVVGFWSSVFLLITAFSGVYLSLPESTGRAVLSVFSGDELVPINSIKVEKLEGKKLEIDEAVKIAKADVGEDAELVAVGFPTKSDQPYRLNFLRKNQFEGTPAIMVFIDPWTKKIIEKRDSSVYKMGNKINAWQHALHSGEWLGVTSKIINFLLGFSLLLFSITGIAMWWIKRRSKI